MVEMTDNDHGREWMDNLADKQATGDRDEVWEQIITG
jgi:hypothetical protein